MVMMMMNCYCVNSSVADENDDSNYDGLFDLDVSINLICNVS
jgi:hypothetical protein